MDDQYTRPQGLYQHKDVDHKKLRKLILDSKLAPCYPGDDESGQDLEECPICFLFYPSLNRSRCCTKGICTECFLQMKTPNSTRPTQCPFCKTLNYAVEYRGVKTKEEKGIEQIEEQRVIEAKIRMRQQELQDEEERMQKRKDLSSSSSIIQPAEIEYSSTTEANEFCSSPHSNSTPRTRHPLRPRQNREDEFDLDLEDIMVMEAIWMSIQEEGKHQNPPYADTAAEEYTTENRFVCSSAMVPIAECSSSMTSSSSPSGGLACAIADLAERQQTGGESSSSGNYSPAAGFSAVSPDERLTMSGGEWAVDDEQEDERQSGFDGNSNSVVGTIVPDTFEEQMMLAMAVSLAEARARPEVVWN